LIHVAQLPTMQGDQDMSDPSPIVAEKPVNDTGGGNAPQADSQPIGEAPADAEETQEASQWLNLTEASQGLADNWILALGRLPERGAQQLT